MVKLIIDFGNTLTKVGFYESNTLAYLHTTNNLSLKTLKDLIEEHAPVKAAILSSVINYPEEINKYLKLNFTFIELDEHIDIPLKNCFQTPETLGKDRLAAVVAANSLYKNQNIMVINAGTCITYDLVNCENEYLGGAISPGTTIRFKALHTFTDKLPLIENSMPPTIVGKTTQECILSGVMNGALAEMDGMIDFFRSHYPDLKIILSGGDAKYFDNRLKNSTFAFPNIVLNGLNIILDHYLEK